jgi:glutamate-1-semialdehyde aminotransferase
MDRGFYLPCSQFEAAFNSALHTRERLREMLDAARAALGEV